MKVFTIAAIILSVISFPGFSGGRAEEDSEIGPYVEFKDIEQVMMLAESKPTVLFFNAGWCPACREARKDFEANAGDIMDINLVLVDYDNSADLQIKYGVTYQHTFVQIAPDGAALKKWNGGGAAELAANTIMKDR